MSGPSAQEVRAWLADHPDIAEHVRRLVDDMPPLPEATRVLLREGGRALRAARQGTADRGRDVAAAP